MRLRIMVSAPWSSQLEIIHCCSCMVKKCCRVLLREKDERVEIGEPLIGC
jgi:hypothetical protein